MCTDGTLAVIYGHAQSGKNFSHPEHTFLIEVERGDIWPLFPLSYCKTHPFCGLFSTMVFAFLGCLLLMILLFKVAPGLVLSCGLISSGRLPCAL